MLSTTRAVVPTNGFLPHVGRRVRVPSSPPPPPSSGKPSTPIAKRLVRFISAAFEPTPLPKVQPRPYRTLQGIPIQDLRPPRFVPPSPPVEGSPPTVIHTTPLSMSRSTCWSSSSEGAVSTFRDRTPQRPLRGIPMRRLRRSHYYSSSGESCDDSSLPSATSYGSRSRNS
ncbi:hypothetical protein C8F01DRAFT_1111705 [Mycena amicta]|nr:hypothetical protein C8F01DRAFT_1111705 [Mycena amicta]